MKILATSLIFLASTGALATDDPAASQAQAQLRTACAQSYASFSAHHPDSTKSGDMVQ